MEKDADPSRLKKTDIVQLLAERHGKFIDKLREVKVMIRMIRYVCDIVLHCMEPCTEELSTFI